MTTYTTFAPVHLAGGIYDREPAVCFRTGTPVPPGGTTILSTRHAWRSLCWFDAEAVSAALSGRRAVSIAVSCRSEGNALESRDPCPLQLYRTTLAYDAEKAGFNSADTARPDAGMTFDAPVNGYFAEYARTEPLERGGTLENSVFMTGDAARRMAQALAEGCALGTWQLKSGSTFSADTPPYRVRYLEDLTLTIGTEPVSREVISPDRFIPLTARASAGGTLQAAFSGTVEQSAENPVTGYLLSFRDREGGAWGEWSESEPLDTAETSGTLTLPAPPAGIERAFRIAAVSAENTGVWREMTGTVTGVQPPAAPRVTLRMQGCAAVLDAEFPPDPAGAGVCRYLLINGVIAGMTGPEGGTVRCRHFCEPGDTVIRVQAADLPGGRSGEQTLPVRPSRCFDRTAFIWNGICSEDLGIRLLQAPDTSFAPAAQRVLRAAGCSESTVLPEDGAFLPAEAEMLLYFPPDAGRDDAGRVLRGEGLLRLGAEPGFTRRAVILSLTEESVYTDGGRKMLLRLLLSPFRFRAKESALPLAGNGNETPLYCSGAADALPLITLTVAGGERDVTLTVNDTSLRIIDARGDVTIDCEKRTVTGPDGTPFDTSGVFPRLRPGINALRLPEGVTGGSIMLRERYL
ncbi:MAG: hypothetical protein CW338_02145 [Clostridiales bacterium]|nr:hypothetical protein [Clostridiales bacterium]